MRTLNASSLLQIEDGIITRYLKVYHDPNGDNNDITHDVISYSWERDVQSQGRCTIYLNNSENIPGSTYHKYSPEATGAGFIPILEGDEIQIIEGINNNGTPDAFYNFFGVVKQAVPQDNSSQAVLELTILDKMFMLKNMEWDYEHEATASTQKLERLYPDNTDDGEFFYATIYTVSPTQITYINDSQEDELSNDGYSGRNILYNFTKGTWRVISSFTNSTNTIKTNYTIDNWQTGDIITNKQWFSIFNLTYSSIKPNSVSLRIRNIEASVEDDPVYDGFGVEYQTGQIVLSAPINVTTYYLYASYKYYASGLTAESLIETIATTDDCYGNSVFSSSDIQETFQNVEGTGVTDTLTGAGNTWYTTYNNIQTTLVSGDFSITGGTFVSFDALTGTLTTSGSPSSVVCSNNYTFKTLQSTGIEIPYYKPSDINTIGRYDAIQQILKNVAPNYKLWVAGNGKLWGNYLTQNTTADATVSLTASNPEQFIHYPDEEVFTRVKLFCENLNPTNELGSADFIWSGLERYDLTNVQLNFVGQVDGFLAFRIPFIMSQGYILSDPKPVLKINDSNVTQESYSVYITKGNDWTIQYINNYQSGLVAIIELPDKNIVPDSVKFYFDPATEDLVLSNEYDFIYDIDYANGVISFYCPSIVIEGIAYMKYFVMSYTGVSSGNDFIVDYATNTVYINPNYIKNVRYGSAGQVIEVLDILTLDFSYVAIGVPDGNRIPSELRANRGYMLDGSPSSAAIWSWVENRATAYEERPQSAVLFVASFSEGKEIDSIKISAGNFYTKVAGFSIDKTYPCTYTMTVKYSPDAIFTADLYGPINATVTTITVKNAKRKLSLPSSDGTILIDGEEIHYTTFQILGLGFCRFNGCTRGYNGTYALPHYASSTMPDCGRVYGNTTFSEICEELTNLEMNTGTNIEIDRNTFGEDFVMGSVQVLITNAEPITFKYSNGEEFEVYPVSISDFRIETNHWLKADIKLAAADSSTTVEDTLGLRTRLGERTYKKTYDNNRILYDQATLLTLGKNLLTEYIKNNTRVQLTEMYHPDWDIGWTIQVTDTYNNVNRKYFCERIRSDSGKVTLDLTYYP